VTGSRTGGQIVADALVAHGVSHVFGVPGESYLAVLDAIHDTDIEFVICRQEGGAAYMAEAWGRLTGDPGVCMVTRGPGATNASVGIHAARENSQPMVVLIGQVATDEIGREAFQEIDYRAFLGPITKWATQIDDVDELAEAISMAFKIAASGRPGPVAIALPEDMLRADTTNADVTPMMIERATPTSDELDAIIAAIADAERPVIIAGVGDGPLMPGPTSPPSPSTTTFRYSPPGDSMTSSTTSATSTAAKPGWQCRRRFATRSPRRTSSSASVFASGR
jgi:acetolactate synthase-1/2/3 large subunit